MSDVKSKIMQVMTDAAALQDATLGSGYPFRMATEYPMRDGAQIPGVEWRSADLRKELIELAKEGLVSKCPHESRIGQAVWRLEVK